MSARHAHAQQGREASPTHSKSTAVPSGDCMVILKLARTLGRAAAVVRRVEDVSAGAETRVRTTKAMVMVWVGRRSKALIAMSQGAEAGVC